MNKVFRSIWNEALGAFVAAPEIAGRGGSSGRPGGVMDKRDASTAALARSMRPSRLALACALCCSGVALAATAPSVQQLPVGGQVVAGQASMQQSGATLNVSQTSQKAILNWQSFDVGAAATVNFTQPGASSVALNRVVGGDPSQIFGRINANGQVFLSNPNGIYFSPTASVNVGSLLATSARISDADFMAGRLTFTSGAANGRVVNAGSLTAGLGGYIALLAPEVRNQGVIVAQLGTVALAAGQAYELQIQGSSLAGITVTPGQLAALVENRSAVQAPGGLVILSAQALNQLQGSVVNSGSVEASSLTSVGGRIFIEAGDIELKAGSSLLADGATGGGTVLVGGNVKGQGTMPQAGRVSMDVAARISASATHNGDGGTVVLWSDARDPSTTTGAHGSIEARGAGAGQGGYVETSGGQVDFGGLRVDTSAPRQPSGTWLVDPYDLNVDAAAASTISANLSTANVVLQTTATASSGPGTANATGKGDININSAVSWSSANTLTLDAYRNVRVAAPVTVAGAGKVRIIVGDTTGTGTSSPSGELEFALTANGFGGVLNFTGTPGGGQSLTLNGASYKLLYSLADLNAINNATSGAFALARSLDLASAGTLSSGPATKISGVYFEGLGHTVSNMSISSSDQNVGFFNSIDSSSVVRNLGIVNGKLATTHAVVRAGLLIGLNVDSKLRNVYATGTVTGSGQNGGALGILVGGLGGFSGSASIANAFSAGTVQAA